MRNSLNLESRLSDLPSFNCQVSTQTLGVEVAQLFDQDPALPGILILDTPTQVGLISREVFFENIGKMYGTEIYYKRPISALMERINTSPLVLSADMRISFASRQVLQRPGREIFEPFIMHSTNGCFRIISASLLFMAQSQILLSLHNQQLNASLRGLSITDDEAVDRFIQFAHLSTQLKPYIRQCRFTVRCETCHKLLEYTIADIVRLHPVINRGIEIKESMGMQFYTFYLRHACGSNVLEIPVQHDQKLEFRSARPPRWIDSYA